MNVFSKSYELQTCVNRKEKVFQFCVTCMRASGIFPMPHFCMEPVFYESYQTHVSFCNPTAYAPLFVCHRLNPVMASWLVARLVVQVTLNRVPVCPGSGFITCNRKWKWGSLKYVQSMWDSTQNIHKGDVKCSHLSVTLCLQGKARYFDDFPSKLLKRLNVMHDYTA